MPDVTSLTVWSWTLADVGPNQVNFTPNYTPTTQAAYTATVPFIMETVAIKATFAYVGSVVTNRNLGNSSTLPINQFSTRYTLAVGSTTANVMWVTSTRDGNYTISVSFTNPYLLLRWPAPLRQLAD